MQGAVTVILDGGGGAALIAVAAGMVFVREAGGDGGFIREVGGDGGLVREVGDDGGFVIGIVPVREIGGDGGLVTGGLSTRFIGLVDCGMVSIRQSCDWCNDEGAKTGGERGSRILCALATLALFRFNFLGGGDGFCREGDDIGLGTTVDFANPLDVMSELLVAESVVLCPCYNQ